MNKFLLLAALSVAGFSQSVPNAVPMPTPEIQYLDVNGAPLSGAYLCTYAAGTTTPLATYTDSTAGSPNTNPIVLDSVGRASVWVGPSLYKFVLRTGGTGNSCSTGSVVWTQDNVADTTLYFVNYVKSIGTASLITTQGTVTGSVSRTQLVKNNDIVSVTDLGADPTGSADSTAAIVQAIADSTITPSGPVCIFFPSGVYKLTAALTSTHPICFVGTEYRLKYTSGATIAAVLTLNGGTAGAPHGSFMEGSTINGAVFDGQGHATNGLYLQAVVSATVNNSRATNVTDAGLLCNWCQQLHAEHWMVSADFETFTTTPARGVVLDGISAANYFSNINIDHVSGTGIDLQYALNSTFIGGTTEGNGGYGVSCTAASSPFRQCFNNMFSQLDTEFNTSGDYLLDDGSTGDVYANTIFEANSFSVPGVTFLHGAHANNIIGGAIGCGSTAGAQTNNNIIFGVSVSCASGVPWVDSGQNNVSRIYNQANGTFTEPLNQNNKESITTFSPGALRIDMYTPNANVAEVTVGGSSTNNFIGFNQQTGLVPWLIFPAAGVQWISESGFRTGAIPEGSVVNHRWGFGRFNTAPSAGTVNTQDSVATTVVDQNGPGQGGTDVHQFMDFNGSQGTAGTVMSKITNTGAFVGPVVHRCSGGGVCTVAGLPSCAAGTEGSVYPVSDSAVNTWGTTITGGSSNHVGAYCNGSNWTVFSK